MKAVIASDRHPTRGRTRGIHKRESSLLCYDCATPVLLEPCAAGSCSLAPAAGIMRRAIRPSHHPRLHPPCQCHNSRLPADLLRLPLDRHVTSRPECLHLFTSSPSQHVRLARPTDPSYRSSYLPTRPLRASHYVRLNADSRQAEAAYPEHCSELGLIFRGLIVLEDARQQLHARAWTHTVEHRQGKVPCCLTHAKRANFAQATQSDGYAS